MSSPVKRELEEYIAGRVGVTRIVTAVMDAYYRDGGGAGKQALQPVIEVIERAAPGVVELAAAGDTPGFRVRLAERPFPERYVPELRAAADVVLRDWSPEAGATPTPATGPAAPGLLRRVIAVIRRLFGG